MTVERDENGKFKKSTDQAMNEFICSQVANKPGKRIMRKLFDQYAQARREAKQNDD